MTRGRSARWDAWAADLTARYPLMATDWEQHSDAVESGFYSVQKRTETVQPAAEPICENAQEPLSPDEEEQLSTLF